MQHHLLEKPPSTQVWGVQEPVYPERDEWGGGSCFNTHACLRGDLSSQNTTVLPNSTPYLSYLILFIPDISEHVLSAIPFDVPTIKDGKRK